MSFSSEIKEELSKYNNLKNTEKRDYLQFAYGNKFKRHIIFYRK